MNRLISELNSMLNANRMILGYGNLKTKRNCVNLHYYHSEIVSDNYYKNNLGDYLSKIVVEWMCKRGGVSLSNEIKGMKHLYAIGSIILMGYQNATIWGTGFPFKPSFLRGFPHKSPIRKLDVRCVRGPQTKKILEKLGHKCAEVYGDPAVLMPLIYTPEKSEKALDFVVIPHFSTEEYMKNKVSKDQIVSMNTDDYKKVIDRICSAKKVISSSLHGIILAESYGVPAVFLNTWQERFKFKFEDWYLSTNRHPDYSVKSIEDAIQAEIVMPQNIKELQNNLINSFPYDLWK